MGSGIFQMPYNYVIWENYLKYVIIWAKILEMILLKTRGVLSFGSV